MCWLSVQPPAHEHETVFMLGSPTPGNHVILIDSSYVCEVTAKVLLLCCECFLFWCLLTLAKKHPSIWEQQEAFKFNGGNDQAKEMITARRP